MRRHDHLARMLQPESSTDVLEASTNRESRRCKNRRFELIEQRLPENIGHRDRCCLQEDVLLSAAAATTLASPLDPEHCVLLVRFHHEAKLDPQLLHAPAEIVYLFRLV